MVTTCGHPAPIEQHWATHCGGGGGGATETGGGFDLERALIPSVGNVEPQYTIEEAARRTGVSTHTLGYYERIGLLNPVGRAASGHRRYTDADLGAVTFLTCLRQTGMPIRQMQEFMELTRAGDATVPNRIEALVAHQESLAEQIALLRRHFEALTNKIAYYREIAEDQRGSSASTAPAQDRGALHDTETPLVDQRSAFA